jgi:hypothetical protein
LTSFTAGFHWLIFVAMANDPPPHGRRQHEKISQQDAQTA